MLNEKRREEVEAALECDEKFIGFSRRQTT